MLHRTSRIFSYARNINDHRVNHLYIFHIGLAKRYASIFIAPKTGSKVNLFIITNSQKILDSRKLHNAKNFKQSLLVSSSYCTNTKGAKDDIKTEGKISEKVQQRIIELDGDNLGQLKERALGTQTLDVSEKEAEQPVLKIEKKKENTKDQVKDESKKAKKKIRVDRSTSSLERNFITPVRAMTDFLLKPSDLENLPKTKRRSPYELEPPITVYWLKDVEAKAFEVWGSPEALAAELLKRELERKAYQENLFTVKRRLREYRREIGSKNDDIDKTEGLLGRSGKVVVTAVAINASNFVFKLIAWIYTGSHSMFSECIHSAADTVNQLILAYGIHKSVQNPNADHPYGYTNMKYVSSLISGVAIFCVGTGLSIYHGIHGLFFPTPVESLYWAYYTLGGSLLSEGATLMVAIHSIRKGAQEKRFTFREYVLGGHDPSVNVVLMEDFAAVLGIICAAGSMGLTSYYNSTAFDAAGSILVGFLLAGVASVIILTNAAALVGKSIRQDALDKINAELEGDVMVRAIHDVKGIDMGNNLVRYKAELDFDGRELTRSYLDKHDLAIMLQGVKGMQNIDELEEFMLKHGENIVDMVGGEIDRIELKLRKNHPEIRHCDLEIL